MKLQAQFLLLIIGIQIQIILGLPLCTDSTNIVLDSGTPSTTISCTANEAPAQVSYTVQSSSTSASIQVSLEGDSHVIDQNTFTGSINAGTTFSTCDTPLLEVESVVYTLNLTLVNPSESGPVSVSAVISIEQTNLEIDAPYTETYSGCCTRFFQFYINPENYGDGSSTNSAYRTTISLTGSSSVPFSSFSLFSENLCSAGPGVFNRTIGSNVASIKWEIDDMSAGWWFIGLQQRNESSYTINIDVEESYTDASCAASGFCSAPDDDSSSGKDMPWYTWFSPVLAFFIVLAVFFSIIGFTEKKEEEQNFTEWAFESVNILNKKKPSNVPEKKYQV